MKTKIFYCCLFILLFSSCLNLDFPDFDRDGYRDGSESGVLTNNGSLIGKWNETYKWSNQEGEFTPSYWEPVNINNSDNYVFLENGIFTSTNNISDCSGTNGTYLVEGRKITLKYVCETQPEIIKEVVIDEFFFRENYIVFKQGDDNNNISKFELAD
ncbi:MAG: hypothetical protein P8P88_06125 [Polaribacter sp.]|nr:hypothetical protein [Polaribacter sp.]